jgi:hypothetical protein
MNAVSPWPSKLWASRSERTFLGLANQYDVNTEASKERPTA